MALDDLHFDNTFVASLPGDPRTDNARRQVYNAAYSRVTPTPVAQPRLLAFAREVAELIGLEPDDFSDERCAEIFAGNRLLPGMDPYAACYGGHQFGQWAGQLGDGRAITLAEVVSDSGRWELQLKGAGPTPYARTADGRAVLRSSLREFLCSEAMHHLGVPTTRALCLCGTGETVVRDMFYDGNPRPEPGAVVCRVAPSFVRFGNFELACARGDHTLLRALADYVIARHFPQLERQADRYARLFEVVSERTVSMIVQWMRVGFVHGVMNTDNMSVLGLTIDYGPYGFLDDYDPTWTPNTTDAAGRRYRYGQQPQIAIWNLSRFAFALGPLVGDLEPLQEILDESATRLQGGLERMLHDKLGLSAIDAASRALAEELQELLARGSWDMTLFFRALARFPRDLEASAAAERWLAPLLPTRYDGSPLMAADAEAFAGWLRRYVRQLDEEALPDQARRARMDAVNPKFVPRNYLAQLAIDRAEQGDLGLLHELLDVFRHPYDEQPERARWAEKRPDWARHRAGCSMLSCSS